MVVKDVDIIHAHAFQALVAAGHQVLARAPVAIGTRPHGIARLVGEDQLVAVGAQVQIVDAAKGLLRRAGRGAIVVGQIQVRHPQVKGTADDRAAVLDGVDPAKVLPETQRDRGQFEATAPAAAVDHRVVTLGCSIVGHDNLQVGCLSQATSSQHDPTIAPTGEARKPDSFLVVAPGARDHMC